MVTSVILLVLVCSRYSIECGLMRGTILANFSKGRGMGAPFNLLYVTSLSSVVQSEESGGRDDIALRIVKDRGASVRWQDAAYW